jgi:hypothetical protein
VNGNCGNVRRMELGSWTLQGPVCVCFYFSRVSLFNADDAAFPPVAAGTSAWPTHQNTCPTFTLLPTPSITTTLHTLRNTLHTRYTWNSTTKQRTACTCSKRYVTHPLLLLFCRLAFARRITCGFVDCETFPPSYGRTVPPTWQQPRSTQLSATSRLTHVTACSSPQTTIPRSPRAHRTSQHGRPRRRL